MSIFSAEPNASYSSIALSGGMSSPDGPPIRMAWSDRPVGTPPAIAKTEAILGLT